MLYEVITVLVKYAQGKVGMQQDIIHPITGANLIEEPKILFFLAFTGVVHRQDRILGFSTGKGIEQGLDSYNFV